jgi:hypothetical protein
MGEDIEASRDSEKQKYFSKRGLTEGSKNRAGDLPVGQITCPRTRESARDVPAQAAFRAVEVFEPAVSQNKLRGECVSICVRMA